MVLNGTKPKEIFICFKKDQAYTAGIFLDRTVVEFIQTAKLLGVQISTDLKWHAHVEDIYKKVFHRIFCELRKASIPTEELIAIYKSMIRQLMDYASPAWHLCLVKSARNY